MIFRSKQALNHPRSMHTNGAEGLLTLLFNLSGNPCQSGYTAAEEHGTKNPISLTICVTTSPPPYPALDKAHGEASGPGCWDSRPHWCEGPLLVSSAFWFQRSNQAKHISNTSVCAKPRFSGRRKSEKIKIFLSPRYKFFGFGVLYKQSNLK